VNDELKWKFRSAGMLLISAIRICRQKICKKINGCSTCILISADMKFRNKQQFRCGIPVYFEYLAYFELSHCLPKWTV
jgi:hypothetical protein